jgi:RNA-directed DNA polymerase
MKRYGNIFYKICQYETLYRAYNNARKGKRYKKEILSFSYHLEENLLQLQNELKTKSYKHGEYRKFTVHDSKKREIKVASFKDRVVHRAVHDTLEPLFDSRFIYDSYACRKNKGIYKALDRLEDYLKNPQNEYFLQCDISRYFKSIDHEILLFLIKKKIKDVDMFWLIEEIVNSYREDDKERKGIPIGNLTSQLFANIYLNELDQKVKHKMKQRYYIRYMDDFIFLGIKKELKSLLRDIKLFLEEEMRLKLHPAKIYLSPVKKGIDFLGYVIFEHHRLLRKKTVKRFLRRTKKNYKLLKERKCKKEEFCRGVESFMAYATHGNSWKIRKSIKLKIKSFFTECSR